MDKMNDVEFLKFSEIFNKDMEFLKKYNICRKCKKIYIRNRRFLCNECLKKKVI